MSAEAPTTEAPPEDVPAEEPTAPEPETPPADTPPADEPLGDAGKRALDAERRARRAAEQELARLRQAQMSDQEKAIEAAKAEGRTEALQIVLDEKLLRHATGKLADPTDALAFVDRKTLTVGDDGKFDEQAIAEAISALLASKPHLAAKTPSATPAPGSANGGPQGGGPAQWTEADLDGKTPEQISAARRAGLLNTLLGIT